MDQVIPQDIESYLMTLPKREVIKTMYHMMHASKQSPWRSVNGMMYVSLNATETIGDDAKITYELPPYIDTGAEEVETVLHRLSHWLNRTTTHLIENKPVSAYLIVSQLTSFVATELEKHEKLKEFRRAKNRSESGVASND